jgi:4'-phosphopantetheinyl transferase EntD
VAVAIADERVGIDIESLERDFACVSSRYMSDQEQALSSAIEWQAMAWCAKEALYKLYGERGLDLKCDIALTDYNPAQGEISALLRAKTKARVEVSLHNDDAVVAAAYFE